MVLPGMAPYLSRRGEERNQNPCKKEPSGFAEGAIGHCSLGPYLERRMWSETGCFTCSSTLSVHGLCPGLFWNRLQMLCVCPSLLWSLEHPVGPSVFSGLWVTICTSLGPTHSGPSPAPSTVLPSQGAANAPVSGAPLAVDIYGTSFYFQAPSPDFTVSV